MFPQEVIQLPRDDQIVLIESFPPIRSKKIKYYEDKFFTKRLLPPTFIPQQQAFDPNAEDNDSGNEEDGDEATNEESSADIEAAAV